MQGASNIYRESWYCNYGRDLAATRNRATLGRKTGRYAAKPIFSQLNEETASEGTVIRVVRNTRR